MTRPLFFRAALAMVLSLILLGSGESASGASVEITVREAGSGKLLPCRIHIKDSAGKAQRAGALPFWFDHFVAPGTAKLELKPGKYTIEIERGPEYRRVATAFEVGATGDVKLRYTMERLADLAAEGWWSGELHVHRELEAIKPLMLAEDLHVAPVITWWNKTNLWDRKELPLPSIVSFDATPDRPGTRFYAVLGGEDEREGGALLYFGLKKPLAIASASREYPSPIQFVEDAIEANRSVWIDIEKPFWWDVPVWLAAGRCTSIGIANNHMNRDRMYEDEAWGKPRPVDRLPAPLGNGYWTQEIYYHILKSGLRVPPSAGSASGVLANPVGYNRVYVHLDGEMNYADWWRGLREGRSFVTNGPLLRVTADGQLPGHVFKANAGNQIKLNLKASLTTQDPVRFVEVIKNGEAVLRVPVDELARTGLLGEISFGESGWFLVRAIAENPKTFRFASTAPFYVEVGDTKNRISKASAQFFLDWTRERMGRVKVENRAERREVLRYHTAAERFWRERVAGANAE